MQPGTDRTPRSQRGPSRRAVGGLVKTAFLLAALGFGAYFVADHWSDTRAALQTLGPKPVIAAIVLGALAEVTSMLGWRSVLADLGHRLPAPAAARVFYMSQLGKYIPGSIWQVAAMVELGRRGNVPRTTIAVSWLVALMVSIVTAAVCGGSLLLLSGVEEARRWLWAVPVGFVAALLALHPRIAAPAMSFLLRCIGRQPLAQTWSGRGVLRAAGWQALTWLLLGGHCWALVIGLGAPAGSSALPAIGGFAVAFAAGVIFLPAPAGAGVREAVLGALLAGVLASGGVVVAVLLSRVLLAVLDVGFGLAFAAAGRSPGEVAAADPTDRTSS